MILLVLAVVLATVWRSTQVDDAEVAIEPGEGPSIAVLPFINRGEEADESLTYGIHDELLTSLIMSPDLTVISNSSLSRYRESENPVKDIARELGVSAVLEGSVQREGERLRVQVRLIDSQTSEVLWANTFDQDYTREDVFRIQTNIALKISNTLNAGFSLPVKTRLLNPPSTSLEASRHFWDGQRLLATRNIAEMKQAKVEFERAVEIDPDYAIAWARLADATRLLAQRSEFRSAREVPVRIQEYVVRALGINDKLGEAYASRGSNLAWLVGTFGREDLRAEAEAAFETAIQLSPGYAPAYAGYAVLLDRYMEKKRVLGLMGKAVDLDPNSPILQRSLAALLREYGRPDDALDILQRIIRFDPGFALAYLTIGSILAEQGRVAEAITWYREAERLDSRFWLLWRKYTDAYLALGDLDGLASVRERLVRNRGADDILAYRSDFWSTFARQGWQAALDWLDNPEYQWSEKHWHVVPRPYVLAVGGDYRGAYESLLQRQQWTQPVPEVFRELIIMQRNQGVEGVMFDHYDTCLTAGVLIEAGENAHGENLLRMSLDFFENELPTIIEDSDRFWGQGLCYLVEGRYEDAFDFFETYVEHGHYTHPSWIWIRQMPWWDPVRGHPRHVALMSRVEELKTGQRGLLRESEWQGTQAIIPGRVSFKSTHPD